MRELSIEPAKDSNVCGEKTYFILDDKDEVLVEIIYHDTNMIKMSPDFVDVDTVRIYIGESS